MSLNFIHEDVVFIKSIIPIFLLFYTSLLLTKLFMLVFFRRLGSKVRGHNIWWWCILVITFIFWIVCVADTNYKCFLGSFDQIISEPQQNSHVVLITNRFEAYCPSLATIYFQNRSLYANLVLDVHTDCLSGYSLLRKSKQSLIPIWLYQFLS